MAKFFDNLGFGANQRKNQSSRRMSRSSDYGSSGRRSTGRNPGTVVDPEHDGRMHHGEEEVGVRGTPLLSYEEWLASHHVPHPGARGNKNALGPHRIPPESLEKIKDCTSVPTGHNIFLFILIIFLKDYYPIPTKIGIF